ncbi:hypothetical protein L3X38_021851 [Prunus dulcis]|uniref:GDSL-like Lipase/Acylhydrolase superfamily protein n=1 Tax=Prunus dulcis TaxID=3755 RepID=A0AAD4VUW7_PRUDU|nr:hypothetical protein L3X38_021851 [Prunus dulcis]
MGGCLDGRLVIDFIAESLGLPLVPPYLESLIISNQTVQNFEAGVNFAVIGAMALDASFLATMGVHSASTNNSLRIQLEWFKQMLPSLCKTSSGVNRARGSNPFGSRRLSNWLHPQVTIIYADYYNALLQLCQFGFTGETSKTCCGGGGPYNFNISAQCGDAGSSVCEKPAQFINWDGMRSTEAAYRWIAKALVQGNYTVPRIATLCVSPV